MTAAKAPSKIGNFVAWITRLKPVMVVKRYQRLGGPLLAAGIAYNSLFALFAGVWIAFSILGLVVSGNAVLYRAVIAYLSDAVPGLIGNEGAISPTTLSTIPSTLTWTGIIALVTLLFTMLGWLGAVRTAIRTQFGLPTLAQPPVSGYLLDLGRLAALGGIMLISSIMSIVTGRIGATIATFLGFSSNGEVASIVISVGGFLISCALDASVFYILFRWIGIVNAPKRSLRWAILGGGVASTVLKSFGAQLIGTGNNPLLAGFATLIGILLWCNFMAQVVVITAAWGAMSAARWPIEPPLSIPQVYPPQPPSLHLRFQYPAVSIAARPYGPPATASPHRRWNTAIATVMAIVKDRRRRAKQDD